ALPMLAVVLVGANRAALAAPDGSYRESCRNLKTAGETLYAQCRDMSGRWRDSSLRYTVCRGDIYNDDGQLACIRTGGNDFGSLPGGSWRQSCRNAYRTGGVIVAECQDRQGRWRRTAIGAQECGGSGRLANVDGELRCE